MQSTIDATAGAMRAQALNGTFRKRAQSRIYACSTTAITVVPPTATIDGVVRQPDYCKLTFASGSVFCSTDPLVAAVLPTTSVDGGEEITTGQVLAVSNLDRISLIASASINVTISFYWV